MTFYLNIHYNGSVDNVKRTYRSKLRAEQTEATRRRILDAARLLFARHGYQGTTMDLLAEEAGVAIQTLYGAFGSKHNLVVALVSDVLAHMGIQEMARQAGEIADAEEALRFAAHINRLIGERMVDLDALLSDLNFRKIAQVSDRNREGNITGVLAVVTAAPQRRQDLSDDEIRDTLLALTSTTLYRMLVQERGWSPERYERWLANLLIAALLREPPS